MMSSSLKQPYQLPDCWTAPEVIEDLIVADAVAIRRSGLSTIATDGEEVCGSAAQIAGSALPRAWFELLERVSTLEAIRDRRPSYDLLNAGGERIDTWSDAEVFPESPAPTTWRYARSNGVALHRDWKTACQRALWELAERDRVLRAWYGATRPERIDLAVGLTPFARTTSYEWRAYTFPLVEDRARSSSFSRKTEVVGVFGFPTVGDCPLVLGFAGRDDRSAAVDAALGEATQQLGFLWGEPIADEAPAPMPTAMHHLDAYQVKGRHAVLQHWLEEGHGRFWSAPSSDGHSDESVGFVDLTPSWLEGDLRVAKAVCRGALPMIFGPSPFSAHMPPDLALHPIP
jgi:hypothetical protein